MNSNSEAAKKQPVATEPVNPMQFIERLPFKTSELLNFKGMSEYDSISKNKIRIMTESEINSKYAYDFSKEIRYLEANQ